MLGPFDVFSKEKILFRCKHLFLILVKQNKAVVSVISKQVLTIIYLDTHYGTKPFTTITDSQMAKSLILRGYFLYKSSILLLKDVDAPTDGATVDIIIHYLQTTKTG